jgi:hypothetical protein
MSNIAESNQHYGEGLASDTSGTEDGSDDALMKQGCLFGAVRDA